MYVKLNSKICIIAYGVIQNRVGDNFIKIIHIFFTFHSRIFKFGFSYTKVMKLYTRCESINNIQNLRTPIRRRFPERGLHQFTVTENY